MADVPHPGEMKLDVGEFNLGVLDALMMLGVAFCNAGVLTRDEIAQAARFALDQQSRQSRRTDSRRLPLETLLKVFSAPVMEGGQGRPSLVPIAGGKADDPDNDKPPRSAA